MSKNSVIITKEKVETNGKFVAQQSALHELKPIVASLIDSVRGDDELTISVEITQKAKKEEKPNAKAAKKPPSGNSSKPAKAKNDESKKDDSGSSSEAGSSEAEGSGADQEVDPLSDATPEN